MNHVLEAVDLPAEAAPAAAAPAWNPVAGLRWENYLRFLLLFGLVGAVGYMAWRPSILRISVLRSLISPSHGDSLAWSPSEEITPLATPVVKTPTPSEWRLASGAGESAFSLRPGTNRIAMWRGAGMARPQWKRSSANSWNWRNDAPFGTGRKADPEAVPPQKPASAFRGGAGGLSSTADAGVVNSVPPIQTPRPAVVAVPSLEAPAIVGGGSFAGLPPLAIPSLGDDESTPREIPTSREAPIPPGLDGTDEKTHIDDTVWGMLHRSVGKNEQSAPTGTEVLAAAAPAAFLTAPPLPAEPIVTAPSSEAIAPPIPILPTQDDLSIPLAGQVETGENVEAQAEIKAVRTAPVVEAFHSENRSGMEIATAPPISGEISAMAPAAREERLEQVDAISTPATTGNVAETDWLNREITAPIEGAYLTIYPKLKFVGLCVPGQNYIRKYNGVAVPRELLGEKLHAEDGRTPYGKYYVAGHRRDAAGARLILSWPSPEDVLRVGLDAGTVEAVENAWLAQEMPPQTTGAGGGIYLSGLRDRVESTDGSFALEKPHLEEIFTALADGAWVFIQE